jgi:ABC-type multidrug transport system fused ATPase/permease subunit
MVIKHGEIIEIGNHDELIILEGYYKDMIKGDISVANYDKNGM